MADRNDDSALAFVTPEAVEDHGRFYRNILEGISLFLVTRHDRIPVHASVVVSGQKAVAITGPNGAGKSTLSYAIYRKGYQLLAEDAVYVSCENGYRLWGNPQGFSLLPDARRLFPELYRYPETLQANGKVKININLEEEGDNNTRIWTFAGETVLCFLERVDEPRSELVPLSPRVASDKLLHERESGFDIAEDAEEASCHLAQRAFLLRNGDFEESIQLIQALMK